MMILKRIFLFYIAIQLLCLPIISGAQPLFDKGWQALIQDNDTLALRLFGDAYLDALKHNNHAGKAQALLYMGICSYGVSYTKGLGYCYRAMEAYKDLEPSQPEKAREGRSRCLLLLATIESRRGNTDRSFELSREALQGFEGRQDTTHSVGLIYTNLGSIYRKRGQQDSAEYYFRLALQEHIRSASMAYLPNAYLQIAELETAKKNMALALELNQRALHLADSTGNRQAQVLALLGSGKWYQASGDRSAAEQQFLKAKDIAEKLNDKGFSLRANKTLLAFYKDAGDFRQALIYQERVEQIGDSIYSWDRQKEIKDLEIQYNVAETERKLRLMSKEREVTLLTNYLLWGSIAILVLVFGFAILMLRRNNKRDKLLLQTKDALAKATEQQQRILEEQRLLKEKQMQQELEFKESQLTAMALQMAQKNELMQELKSRMEEDKTKPADPGIHKIINKGLNQDKEWSDFNLYFESMNQHFYGRLKDAYPDISPNDLKICALIKLHLSIKEMATILNISPDSVKTARYRLRKKLQLNNEDNLTDFIMKL